MIEVSIVLPALNEISNLRQLLPALLRIPLVSQVIVVDDASSDGTAQMVGEMRAEAKGRLLLLCNPVRLGLACSVLQGIRASRGTHILVRDSDLGHDLKTVEDLIEEAGRGRDFVVASRYLSARRPERLNDFFSALLNAVLKKKFGKITDWTHGYYLVKGQCLRDMPAGWIFRGRGEYSVRLYRHLLSRGVFPTEVATLVRHRGAGQSTTSLMGHGLPYLEALLEDSGRSDAQSKELLRAALSLWRRKGGALARSGHSMAGIRGRKALMLGVSPQGPTLDLGCGTGAFTRAFFSSGLIVDGVDLHEDSLKEAERANYRRTFLHDLAKPLPHSTEREYSSVFCFEVFQYLSWERLPKLFAEISAKASDKAKAFIIIPNRTSLAHRVRRLLGFGKEDYVCVHDVALVVAAAQEAGWVLERARGAAFGASSASDFRPHNPGWNRVHLLLQFTKGLARDKPTNFPH